MRQRLDLQTHLVRTDERKFGESAILKLENIASLTDNLKSLLRQVVANKEGTEKAFNQATKNNSSHPHLYEISELEELESKYYAYTGDPEADTGQLIVAIRAARNAAQSDTLDAGVRSAVKMYLAAVEAMVDTRTELKGTIDEYIAFVRDTEVKILSRHAVES